VWTWQGVTAAGTPVCDLFDATGRSITIPLTGAPTAQWTTKGDSASALRLSELTHDLVAYRDGTKLFRGRLGAAQDSLDAGGHQVSWNAVGYEGVVGRRVVWSGSTASWTATDQALIVKDLIDDTQALPDGDLGIDTSALTATGITRDYTVDLGKDLGSTIDALAQMINGFDWWIDPDLVAHIASPRGTTLSWSAVWGVNIDQVTRTTDPTAYASDELGIGGTGTTPHTEARTPRDFGRWEKATSWSDVTIQSTLNAHVAGDLLLDDWFPSYELVVSPGKWDPSIAWLGDTIGLVIKSGRLDVATTGRIVQVKFDIGDNGLETTTLTLDRVIPDLTKRLGALGGRVGNLERR